MPNRINEKIKGLTQVRLVGDNVEPGVVSYTEAMRIADEMESDDDEPTLQGGPVVSVS